MAQWVKNWPAMQETREMQVWSLGREDSLEEENGNPLLPWQECHDNLVFLPEKSHRQRSLGYYSPKDPKNQTRLSDYARMHIIMITFSLTLSDIINILSWHCFLCNLLSCIYCHWISLIQFQALLHLTTFVLQFSLIRKFFPLSFAWLCLYYLSDLSSSISSFRGLPRLPYLMLFAFPNTIPVAIHYHVTYLISLV